MDPIFETLQTIPFSILRPPRLRLKLPTITLPSSTTVLILTLTTYFLVISGIVYDIIVKPPGIGSAQDPNTGTVRPVVFLSGRVNGQYIIEGLSSGFMFFLAAIGIIFMDFAFDHRKIGVVDKSDRVSYGIAGVSALVIGYVMSMLFIRIKIPGYLR